MKGIIFALLAETVINEHGPETWDALLESTGLDGAWTTVGSYPDEELLALVDAGASALSVEPNDLVRWFGRASMPLLADRYPQFFEPHTSVSTFLLALNEIIHPEVRKLYPDAVVPKFEYLEQTPSLVVMAYSSPRRLCSLAEGFIEGAAALFGESTSTEQTECMLRGDGRCVLRVAIAA